ncbi:hypothetical protein SMC26_34170 [Actinomadura fulvescens]|uniref:Polysaccharide deacetylase n=1 Tax=Actinomadura fulvescens TaxID=46160 RepID=A0ABP6C1J8_9ACTN
MENQLFDYCPIVDREPMTPVPLNYGWRDYGPRVAIWRLMQILDRHRVRASVLLNSDVTERYPQIIQAGRARGWAWLAHGKTNSILPAGTPLEEERAFLADVVEIHRAGHRATTPRLAGTGTQRDLPHARTAGRTRLEQCPGLDQRSRTG